MADHGQVEYATAEGNDLPAHVAMYDRFVHLVVVGGAHVTNIVLGPVSYTHLTLPTN